MTRADPTANLPPPRVEPDTRRRIRRALAEAGRRIAVLDDDPTGSETVHGVDVGTVFESDEIAVGLSEAGSTCFFLTNSRSQSEAGAVELNIRIGRMLSDLAARLDARSTWSAAATRRCAGTSSPRYARWTPCAARRPAEASRACLLCPAYVEAGRFTAGNVHWARVGTDVLPVARPSSPATPPSDTPPPTCATSSPRRAAARSSRATS